jgi:hypothetical protein
MYHISLHHISHIKRDESTNICSRDSITRMFDYAAVGRPTKRPQISDRILAKNRPCEVGVRTGRFSEIVTRGRRKEKVDA